MYSTESDSFVSTRTTSPLWGVFLFLWLPFFLQNCAQVAQPPGGKKDTLAPKLISSIPANRTRNFKGKEILLTFDEYIAVDNLVQKTIVTPGTGLTFDFKLRPTSLLLKFNQPFKDSTTYTISFTDAVRDATERNPAANLKLVFSTGKDLDSLGVSGTITDINSGTVVEGALVGLYAYKDTLDAQKEKPVYYSKSDTSGLFSIENVKSGTYDLIAFTDRNSNFVFNPQSEKVGFYKDRLILTKSVKGVGVSLFGQNITPVKIARTESRSDNYTINLDKGINLYSIRFKRKEDSIPAIQVSANQIKFFRTRETADTLPMVITTTDSLGIRVELKHTIKFRAKSKKEKPELQQLTIRPDPNQAVEPSFIWSVKFSKPIETVNTQDITILGDSLEAVPLNDKGIQWANNRSELTYAIRTKARKEITIKLTKNAFLSVQGDTIQPTQLRYSIINSEDFGLIRGTVKTSEPTYMLELLDEQGRVVSHLNNISTYEFKNIKPGIYRLRLVIDRNKNGRWDTGDYRFRQPAEPILYYKEKIIVKQNFELEAIDLQF